MDLLLIFSTWLIIASFVQPSPFSETQDLIKAFCHQTLDYGFCTKVFNQNLPLPYRATNLYGLTEIALDQLRENSTNTRIFIQKKEAAEKCIEIRHLYETCNADYGAVAELSGRAMKELRSETYEVMLTHISESKGPVNDCEHIFGGNIEIGLKERCRQVKVLINMSITTGIGLVG